MAMKISLFLNRARIEGKGLSYLSLGGELEHAWLQVKETSKLWRKKIVDWIKITKSYVNSEIPSSTS